MNVARSSGFRASARLSNAAGSAAYAAFPFSRKSVNGSTAESVDASKPTTCLRATFTSGDASRAARTFFACSSFDTNATVAPESFRRYATCSATIVGKIGTRTAP